MIGLGFENQRKKDSERNGIGGEGGRGKGEVPRKKMRFKTQRAHEPWPGPRDTFRQI